MMIFCALSLLNATCARYSLCYARLDGSLARFSHMLTPCSQRLYAQQAFHEVCCIGIKFPEICRQTPSGLDI